MAHNWRFGRAGGFDQVKLESGADLVALGELDQKLWVALACPVKGLEFDARTLALIDTDRDGRVRASELIGATKWAGTMLANVAVLARGVDGLDLEEIDRAHDEGKALHAAAVRVQSDLGVDSGDPLTVAHTDLARSTFDATPFNGDGVIVEASAGDDTALVSVIADIVAATEAPPVDRSGAPGLDRASAEAFFAAVDARAAWLDAGKADGVLPLGDDTAAAWAALSAVRAKIDDYFARCNIAAFDPRALEAVQREQSEYLAIAAADLTITADEIAHFPLAMVGAAKELPLVQGVNPAWADRLEALRTKVIAPLTGEDAPETLSEASWHDVRGRLAAYEAWLGAEAGAPIAGLAADRVRELADPKLRQLVEAKIDQDLAAAPESDAIESVERLVRYVRDLLPLANNFVAFRDFYARTGPAIFQAGTLYIDQRACELCIQVNDAGKHATMAPLSSAYLLYCDLRNAKGEKKTIAAAMTDGDVDNLMVGRNGVFYDRDGNDWDATVTKIVENPISIRQAFWSPYKRFLRAIESFVASRAAAAEAQAEGKVDAAASAATATTEGKAPEPAKLDVGMIAALGVAVGGITAALGALLQAFFGLGIWMPVGVLGLILLISGPSMAVAWLKLRQRNLGPLLDANGWAVNARAKLNVPLGKSLTQVAKLPPGSARDLRDPYAEKRFPWWLIILLVVVLGGAFSWYAGTLDRYLPAPAKSTTVMGELAPAYEAEPEPEPAE